MQVVCVELVVSVGRSGCVKRGGGAEPLISSLVLVEGDVYCALGSIAGGRSLLETMLLIVVDSSV